jgi:hypothetical protein
MIVSSFAIGVPYRIEREIQSAHYFFGIETAIIMRFPYAAAESSLHRSSNISRAMM